MIPAETIREMLATPEQNKPLEELLADKRVMLYDLAQTALELYEKVETLERKLKAVIQFGNDVCLGCNREIDTTTCCCGDSIDHGFDSHSAVPMGCDCGRVKSDSIKPIWPTT